jgi:hypothetical protein
MNLEVTRTQPPARCLAIRGMRGDFAAIPATLREVYATFDATYHALGRWTEAHGLRWVGPPEELYLSPPEVPEDETRTQVRVAIVEPS